MEVLILGICHEIVFFGKKRSKIRVRIIHRGALYTGKYGSQASLAVHFYPFTLLIGERHCEYSTMTQPDLDPRPLGILSGSMG